MDESEVSIELVRPLLRNFPLRERIEHLWHNQELGGRLLTKLPGYADTIYPNCFGTALFVLGAERKFLERLEHKSATNGVVVSRSGKGGFAVFPKNFDSPGILQPDYMKIFLSKCQKVDTLQQGDITYEEGFSRDEDGSYEHSMLFLGNLGSNPCFFQQDGLGGRFNFRSFKEFKSVPAVSQDDLRADPVLAYDKHFFEYGQVIVREFYRYNTKE
ncbi:MAG: hypothetical protein Q7R87_03795 [Nanoarchaeota archaeon]|nr:hypothetical protein [Nanoarchaeota archaeon]